MAPTYRQGKFRKFTENTVVDARQIIQRNKVTNRVGTNNRNNRGQNNQGFRGGKLAGRLGNSPQVGNRKFQSGRVGKLSANLAGRIGNVGNRSQGNVNVAQQGARFNRNQPASKKEVLFLGKKLLVTAKQAPGKSRMQNVVDVNIPSRTMIKEETLQGLESYLKLIQGDPQPVAPQIQSIRSRPSPISNKSSSTSILVSNLHPSVTENDIFELFGDIGSIISAKLQHPGAAVIVYEKMEDAMKACEIYHNRLLDEQPMQCSLLGLSQPGTPSIASRLGGRVQNVQSESNFSPSPSLFQSDELVKKLIRQQKLAQAQRVQQQQRQRVFPATAPSRSNVTFTVQIP